MTNKYFYFIVACLFATQSIFAQCKISGFIKDKETNEKLTGVSVYINDLKIGAITNPDGQFEINHLKPGNYLIEVSFLGFQPIVHQFYINKDTLLDFELISSHKEISDVIITGVSRSTEIKHNPVIIKSIDKNYLNQSVASNLIDALKNVPGINQITTGASISKPVIRGLGYNRVISLLNGIKQEGQQWGDEHGIEIDEYAIDKIEMIKGPGSLMYGSDGIAGVINFISPKAPTLGKIKTQLISNYQSNNGLIGHSLSNAGNIQGIQWLGRLSHKYAGNFQNQYDGKVFNSGFKELDGNLFVGINKNWGHTHLHFNSFNTTINLPEGERDSLGRFVYANSIGEIVTASKNDLNTYKTGFPHQVVNHARLSANNYFILKKGTVNVDLGVQRNKRKEYADIANPNDIELFFDLQTFNYNARYNFEKKRGWETSIGFGGMLQTNTNRGEEYLIPNYSLLDMGVFLCTQKSMLDQWTFAGGIRFDNRTVNSKQLILDGDGKPTNINDSTTEMKFDSFSENYQGISGSVGVAYQVTKSSTLKLNISRGFRSPNIAELASNGKHEGTFRYELGDPKLKSEISHQIDLAYFVNNEHLAFEFTPFVNFISNYIYTKKLTDSAGNDLIIDPSDPAPAFKFTQGQATLLGGEIYIDFHPHPYDWLHIGNSFSYVQAKQSHQTDSTRNLPFIPPAKYRGELKAEFKKVGHSISNAYIKFGLDYFFKQNRIYSAYDTETATKSYTLLGAGIGCNINVRNKKEMMSIFLSGENLTNKSYQNHLSRLKYAPEKYCKRSEWHL